ELGAPCLTPSPPASGGEGVGDSQLLRFDQLHLLAPADRELEVGPLCARGAVFAFRAHRQERDLVPVLAATNRRRNRPLHPPLPPPAARKLDGGPLRPRGAFSAFGPHRQNRVLAGVLAAKTARRNPPLPGAPARLLRRLAGPHLLDDEGRPADADDLLAGAR